ncbi:hypothetical protein [Hymenobacter cheonanensis]|uniref:hypothetical protein n=1 Tax=Hymenobacter sp. CA2-7 TaxID=3063993 RepID=UPI0027140025|nr:hypothetical protein [Hymenobacter sp. CA2-7]MDO7885325.1 hypothetical protein [Hymenobacter sp. CA2-7]
MGHTVNYQNAEQLLIGWEIGAHDTVIEHDGGQWHIPCKQLAAVLVAWEGQVQRLTGVALPSATPDVTRPTTMLHDVNQLLLESMRKVRDDPGYAPQARAMADTAQAIINGAKVQVEAARLLVQAQHR